MHVRFLMEYDIAGVLVEDVEMPQLQVTRDGLPVFNRRGWTDYYEAMTVEEMEARMDDEHFWRRRMEDMISISYEIFQVFRD